MTSQPNVFLLSVDSLPYSSFESASERLASLIEGVNFTQAVAPASFTSSSMPAIATGTLTDQIPAWGLPETGSPTPIAEELESAGYKCGLWTDNYLFGSAYNYDRGFVGGNLGQPGIKKRAANFLQDTPLHRVFGLFEAAYFGIIEPLLSATGTESSFYRHAEQLNELALDWLDSQGSDSSYFCWLHYMDTHHPYQPPTSYLSNRSFNTRRTRSELGEFTRDAIKSNGDGLSEEDLADLQTVFDACCEYTEDKLVGFIKKLQQRGHYNPEVDILIVTADHGEVLDKSNRKMLGHVPPSFWEEIVRVPLIIGHPQWSQDSYSHQVSLLDLKRVILDGVGIDSENLSADDLSRTVAPFVSEWEELHEDSITTYRGVRRNDGKKLFGAKLNENDRLVTTDCIDGTTERIITNIPFENLGDDLLDWEHELLEELSAFGDAIESDSSLSQVREEVDKQHLKDLGYLE